MPVYQLVWAKIHAFAKIIKYSALPKLGVLIFSDLGVFLYVRFIVYGTGIVAIVNHSNSYDQFQGRFSGKKLCPNHVP
jgi:hypothetical protein